MTAFYSQLASLVRGNTNRRLVLTTENLFSHPQLSVRVRPNLLAESAEIRVAVALLDVGLDRQTLERVPGLVLCPTRYVEPKTPLPNRAVDLELNDAFALWRQTERSFPVAGCPALSSAVETTPGFIRSGQNPLARCR